MKKIMFMVFLVISCGRLFSQTYYIILTSQQLKGRKVTEDGGIYKIQLSKPSEVQKSPSIFFSVESPDRKIYESFRYADHDVEKLQALRARSSSDPKWAIVRSEELTDTLIKPVSFLKTIHPIDLDKEFPVMTLESAKKLFEPLRGKKVYIIDRNDITDTTVKLIGVRYVTPRSQVPVYVDGEFVIQ